MRTPNSVRFGRTVTLAAAVMMLGASAAMAQTTSSDQNQQKQTGNGSGSRSAQQTGVPPMHFPSAAMPFPSAAMPNPPAPAWMLAPQYPKYPTPPSNTVVVNPPYWVPGPSAQVIVNPYPVLYPVADGAGGYYYVSTPPLATFVQTLPGGQTSMTTVQVTGCAFPGYATSYLAGQTVISPFSMYVGCPDYLYNRYVVLGRPTAAGDGVISANTIDLYSGSDPYVTANEERIAELRAALSDIQAFWQQGRQTALRRRVVPDVTVAVFSGDRFLYSLHRSDFLALAADAMDQVHTVSFNFVSVRRRSDGLVTAIAEHAYYPRDGKDHALRTVQVRYTFVYLDGDWYVTAVTLSPDATSVAR